MKTATWSFVWVLLLAGLGSVQGQQISSVIQIGEDIQLIPLSDNVIIHRSYKVFEGFGRTPSNGLIYIVDSTCYIMDTPVTEKTTVRLLDHLTQERGLTIKALVVNHFHEDCVAGLDSVKARGIPTYSNKRTAALLKAAGGTLPKKTFGKKLVLKHDDHRIVNYYPGPAHTDDNIVTYLPDEQVLFGGCMVKAVGAGKGNIADADLAKWPATIAKVKKTFPEAKTIIPGHGFHGGQELLDYTIELFTLPKS
jgi:metallo-beta-lactamase class B